MRPATATILLGVTIGIVGVFVYTRLRSAAADEDAEALINRLSSQLSELEAEGVQAVVSVERV